MVGRSESARRVLWVEDEPNDFSAAGKWLARRGWDVVFKRDIIEAAQQLAEVVFHALIMDLLVPSGLGHAAAGYRIWSTYRLLCWLGGEATLAQTDARDGLSAQWSELDRWRPLEANMRVPAMVVSAYHDLDVTNAMRAVNQTRTGHPIDLHLKPIEAGTVPEKLEKLILVEAAS